jgi:xylose isomerase
MKRPNRPRYAARLNAFRRTGGGIAGMIAGAGRVGGIDAADLNYPDHFSGVSPDTLSAMLGDSGMALNGLAMRYYTDPGFALGAFTNPDPGVRRAAIDLTKRGIDAGLEMGGRLMTLWMGQDGFDYAFQGDYGRMWDDTVAAIAEVADHAPEVDIAIEYKPNEPRAYALMPDVATTLLAVKEVGRANLGVTLDFAHVLYADEMPAHTAHLIARHARLLGVHLNDGYGKRDDGLMVGSVHPQATLDLLREVHRGGYDGAIYFDTFPDASGLDPVAECAANIRTVQRMLAAVAVLEGDNRLAGAQARQDPVLAQEIAQQALTARPLGA